MLKQEINIPVIKPNTRLLKLLINKERAYAVMEKNDIEALIASTPANVLYFSGFFSNFHWMQLVENYAIFFRDRNVEPSIIFPSSLTDVFYVANSWIKDIYTYGDPVPLDRTSQTVQLEPYEQQLDGWYKKAQKEAMPADLVAQALLDKGITKGKIALDEVWTTPPVSAKIKEKIPNAEVINGNETIRGIRWVKTPEEIKRLGECAAITEKAIQSVYDTAKEGVTEGELIDAFKTTVVQNKAQPFMLGVNAGRRTVLGNADVSFSNYRLKRGDIIRFDVGLMYKGYCSDVARLGSLGKPDQILEDRYNACIDIQRKAIEAIKPGVTADSIGTLIDKHIMENNSLLDKMGYYGHGLGIQPDFYDFPLLKAGLPIPLEENMVMCVEVGSVETGVGSVLIEDEIVIKQDHIEFLTKSDPHLKIL